MPTHEVENGMVKAVTAEFARFQSMAECFAARDQLIATSSLFAEARACAANAEAFARAIAKHWATDPAYAEKAAGHLPAIQAAIPWTRARFRPSAPHSNLATSETIIRAVSELA